MVCRVDGLHWVDSPEDQSETSNRGEESGGLLILVLYHTAAVDTKLIDDDQVGEARHSIPTPLGACLDGESSEETGQNHDDVSDDGDEDVGTAEASNESQVHE